MLATHWARGTWSQDVDVYVALTQFARRKFIEGGLPEQKIVVKPNFVEPDPGVGAATGGYFLYAGRLSEEKGLRTLLRAWAKLDTGPALRIAGAGPLEGLVQEAAAACPTLRYLGHLQQDQLIEQIRAASALVFPSEWYEGLPVTVLQAFACGRPVIAARLGAAAEIVADGETGVFFCPGDADELAHRLEWAFANAAPLAEMGRRARREFEARYTAEVNYHLLLGIYQRAAGA
jgi:glycosyltransferase involved in cell wall biosynthesis